MSFWDQENTRTCCPEILLANTPPWRQGLREEMRRMLGLENSPPQALWGLKSLPVPTHCWKNLLMDFVTGLPISTDWKGDNYDSILVIVNWLTKMVYYELVKVTIDVPGLAEVIINMVERHHGLPDSIVSDQESLFISKFWSSLCYFLGMKQKLSTAFYPQINEQTKR